MDAAPDVAVISMVDPNTDEVAAFEELIGSHGGLGGAQTAGLLVVPAEWAPPDDEPIGAPAVHRLLRGWLAGMGIGPDATADGAPRSRR